MATKHTVSPTDPTYVTSADHYRISFTLVVTPDLCGFAELEDYFPADLRRPDGYGIALLQSEEHSLTYIGTPAQIREHQAAVAQGPSTLDASLGTAIEFWPRGAGWNALLPDTTWNEDGTGVITEFDHRGAKVLVYEYLEPRDGKQIPMVAFHCEVCHNDPRVFLDHASENHGPQDRCWIARKARSHMRAATHHCRPTDPRLAETVTAVANNIYGTNNPVVTHDSRCAATGPCSQIRHLRAAAASRQPPHDTQAQGPA